MHHYLLPARRAGSKTPVLGRKSLDLGIFYVFTLVSLIQDCCASYSNFTLEKFTFEIFYATIWSHLCRKFGIWPGAKKMSCPIWGVQPWKALCTRSHGSLFAQKSIVFSLGYSLKESKVLIQLLLLAKHLGSTRPRRYSISLDFNLVCFDFIKVSS